MVEPLGQSAFIGEGRAVSAAFDDRETAASRRLCVAVGLALRPEPSVVLDLGCGTGEILELLRARLPHARLVGVDPVPEAIAGARERMGEDDRLTLLETAAEDLGTVSSAAGSREVVDVDLALCHLNLALWRDPVAGLTAAVRRLAPGGVLYAVDLARVEGERRARLLTRARTAAERDYLAGQIDASFDLPTAQRILEEVVASLPELGLTARCAAGGLAGHPFRSPEAARMWADPAVQHAIAGFERPADGAGDDDVLHWELRRA